MLSSSDLDQDFSSSLSASWSTIQTEIGFSPRTSDGATAEKITESIYLIHQPQSGPVELEVIFFHGLQRGDHRNAHIDTWMSRSDPPVCWIRTWLVENFPQARILTVAYDSSVTQGSARGRFDLHLAVESLSIEILTHAKVGKKWGTPVIMVGHCLGGLVIKQLCTHIARKERESRLDEYQAASKDLTYNLMGVFFFGTPQSGMNFTDGARQLPNPSPLLKSLEALNNSTSRLNEIFEIYRRLYNWETRGVGESSETQSGGGLKGLFHPLMVNEGAARHNVDQMFFTGDDHFNICKPLGKTSASFQELTRFISDMLQKAQQRNLTGQHMQKLPTELVGLEVPLGEVKRMLHPEDGTSGRIDHVAVGIAGVGGIGKTTLARALFNDLSPRFEYSCYVENVKSIPNFTSELLAQKYLYRDGKKVPENSSMSYLEGLKRRTFLLVLDDVSKREHLDIWYKELARIIHLLRSRLIVTTRYHDLLKNLDSTCIYDMPFLDGESSKTLLIKHCFPFPDLVPEDLQGSVEKVAMKCDGLPLTLEVIGKFLRKKSKVSVWDACLHELDEASASDESVEDSLWRKLKLSYTNLNEQRRMMFLDAATVFNGLPLYQAKAAWSGGFASDSTESWKHLVDMSLVYDVREGDDTDIIRLHEQLRSLGRRLSKEDKNERRVWDTQEAWDVLTEDDDSEDFYANVVGLRFHFSELPFHKKRDIEDFKDFAVVGNGTVVIFPRSVFWRMKRLKYLFLKGVDIGGIDAGNTFRNKLVLLIWSSGGTFPELPVSCSGRDSKLAVLHLYCPSLTHLPDSIRRHSDLRVLELLSAKLLVTLPEDILQLRNLERLTLIRCPRLNSLPKSFHKLGHLTHIEFKDCPRLTAVPSLRNLSNLKCLSFYRCKSLEELPDCGASSSSVETLDLHRCLNLSILPPSLGQLPKLKSLRITGKFHELPESFGQNFPSLMRLQLQYCKNLLSLPHNTFRTCKSLEYLIILRCQRLQELPDPEWFSHLELLRHVRFGWVALSQSMLFQHYQSRLPGFKRSQVSDHHTFDFRVVGKCYNPTWPSWRFTSISDDEELAAVSGDDEAFQKRDETLQFLRILDSPSANNMERSKAETREFIKGENLNYRYLTLECVHDDVQQIIVKVESHDQGFSNYEFAQGTDNLVDSYVELSVLNEQGEEFLDTRRRIISNLNAIKEWQEYSYVMSDRSFLDCVKPGYKIALWLRSRFPAWVTYARYGSIEIVSREEDTSDSMNPLSATRVYAAVTRTEHERISYLHIQWLGHDLEKIYVEVDSHDQGFSPEQMKTHSADFLVHDGGSTWAELGIRNKDGKDVGQAIRVGTNLCAVRGWQRHSCIVEDVSFFSSLEEGCSIVLWIRSKRMGWHNHLRSGRINLIPKQNGHSTIDRLASRDSGAMFPYGRYVVETDERLQRGRSLNYIYLVYQNQFPVLQQINVVAEAHDHGSDRQGRFSTSPKFNTHGELGILGLEGEEIGERVEVYRNKDRDEDRSWQRHCYKVDSPEFLSRIKVGYKVVLWLRSGPGSSQHELSVHCARYASIELVPNLGSI